LSAKNRVIVDERERASGVPETLREMGLMVECRLLDVADYVVPGYAIERKESRDFVRSLYSGRIFDQAHRLRETYANPILIVEGDIEPLMDDEKIKPQVYWGAITSLTFDFGFKVFFTSDAAQTANLIYALARKRPLKLKGGPIVKKKPKVDNLEQIQMLTVSTLPGIGPKLADRLLREFKTIRRVFAASKAELSTIKGVGRVKADRITRTLDALYRPLLRRPRHLDLTMLNP